jgi:hypothetical protein
MASDLVPAPLRSRRLDAGSCRRSVSTGASQQATLTEEVAAWEDSRNTNHTKANGQFTTADARVNLKRFYPTL